MYMDLMSVFVFILSTWVRVYVLTKFPYGFQQTSLSETDQTYRSQYLNLQSEASFPGENWEENTTPVLDSTRNL
jgi:hypothetical protein